MQQDGVFILSKNEYHSVSSLDIDDNTKHCYRPLLLSKWLGKMASVLLHLTAWEDELDASRGDMQATREQPHSA